jgi:hypothetical protein
MAIANVQTTGWQAKYEGVDTDAEATLTFSGVLTGSLLVVTVEATRYTDQFGTNIIDGMTSAGGTINWQLAKRKQKNSNNNSFTQEITEWFLPNAASGTHNVKIDQQGTAALTWRMHGEEYSGCDTANPLGASADNSGNPGSTSATSGSTGTLPQANMVVRATILALYETLADAGSGWTQQIEFEATSEATRISTSTLDKIVASTAAQTASWTIGSDPEHGWCAIITAYKQAGAAVNKRIEITGCETSVNGTTGWTVYFWKTDPGSGLVSGVYKVTGLTAEATGGKIYVTGASVPNDTDGTQFNCIAYRPGGSPVKGLAGVVLGTLKDY